MTRRRFRAGFGRWLRPSSSCCACGVKIAASIVLTLLALLFSLSTRQHYPLPASTLARALLAPQEMGEQPRSFCLISAQCRS